MKDIFEFTLKEFKNAKKEPFGNTAFATKFKNDFISTLTPILPNKELYIIKPSIGTGSWAEIPWIAIFDRLITTSAQNGYYPVYLFQEDLKGFYLSLNQGVTEVIENYKGKDKVGVLKARAENFRKKINVKEDFSVKDIDLKINKKSLKAKYYEYGNIYAKHYDSNNLPSTETLIRDLLYVLELYQQLIKNDIEEPEISTTTLYETKKFRYHLRVERNQTISESVKKIKGYTCEACNFEFYNKYGAIGKDFIEAHHLTPISSLEIGETKLDAIKDFAVLCSNCHRMIHKLPDSSNIELLKEIIKDPQKRMELNNELFNYKK